LVRVLERLGLADVYGRSRVPLYVMNVAYPVVDAEVLRFCQGKRAVLLVEEGQPNFVEQNVATVLRQAGCSAVLHGKDLLPPAGEYTVHEVLKGVRAFAQKYGLLDAVQAPSGTGLALTKSAPLPSVPMPAKAHKVIALKPLQQVVQPRPPGFCTGCPERPIFAAMKLVEKELGPHHVSADIGCHLFSILPPFHIGNTTMGYGLGTAGASAMNVPAGKKAISIMGDGGFWHNGLTSGIANAVFNRSNNLTIVVDNSYTSATGGQDVLSSKALNPTRSTGHLIEKAVRGVGVEWVRTFKRTYDVAGMRDALKEALTSTHAGPKVLVAQSECMLNRQRREKPQVRAQLAAGKRVVRERFGVDADTCTGDRACIRISGCPSLSIKPNPDPLRTDPVTTVLDSCVGCGMCGEVSHAAVLCPSFYKAQIVSHPSAWERWWDGLRVRMVAGLQRRRAQKLAQWAF